MPVTYAAVVVNLPSLLKGKSKTYLVGLMRSLCCLGVAAPFQLLNQLTDFHETWLESYTFGDIPILTFSSFHNSIIRARRTQELVRRK
jgi:hypothetical protein